MAADLALTRPDPSLTMDRLRAEMEAAKRYVDSGLLPSGIKTPQQALTIMSVGREVGVPATYALRNIHVIEGKPTCSAELLMALVRRSYGQAALRVREATNEACTVEYREQGWDGVSSLTFTIDDARKAQLAEKAMWKKYPRAMLRSRAVSECVRTAFPECIAGLYTPEELGAEVRVADDGSVEIAPPPLTTPALSVLDHARERPERTPHGKVTARLASWFALVRGTSLDTDDARGRYVGGWCTNEGWAEGKWTDSLRMLATRQTDDEWTEFYGHTVALVDDERTAVEEALEAARRVAADLGETISEESF